MNKIKRIDLIYCIALAIFIISRILSHTSYNISINIKHSLSFIATLIIVFKILMYDKLSLKEFSIYLGMIIVSILSILHSKEYEILCTVIFIIGAKNISFDLIAKTYRFVASILISLTVLFSLIGLIKENLFYRGEIVRRTFGYSYPTDFIALIFYILLVDWYLCIKHKKNIWWRLIIYLGAAILTMFYCDSRLGSIFILMLIPISLIVKYCEIYKKNLPILFFEKYSVIICTIISIMLVTLYIKYPSSNLLYKIDSISSFRLTLTVWALKMFGYPLWGRDIYTEYFSMNNDKWFFIDNSYYCMLIQYGMIFSIMMILLITFNNKKLVASGNKLIPFVFCLIALNSIVGQQFFLLEYNIFLLVLKANV